MAVTYKETHVAEAVDRLTQYLKDSTSVTSLISALTGPTQDLEDVCRDLRLLRTIDTAQGEQLDIIGRVIGLARDGISDTLYRQRLRAWFLVLDSGGTVPQLIKILLALFPDAEFLVTPDIDLMTGLIVPGHLTITFYTDLSIEEGETAQIFVRTAKAAGIRIDLIYSPDVSNAFTFTPYATGALASTTQGFAEDTTPSTGGFFVPEIGV